MKKIALTIALFVGVTVANAQLTAADVISKITCKDKACFDAFIVGKGYNAMPTFGASARSFMYVAKANDCNDTNGKPTHTMLTVMLLPNGLRVSYTTLCEATYNSIVADYKAKGFTKTLTVPTATGGETITTYQYTSAAHPNIIFECGKGEKNGKKVFVLAARVK